MRAKPERVNGALLLAGLLVSLPLAAGEDAASRLLRIKRVHVERLGGGEAADQIRDMIIASLQRTGLFVLTENPERADAFLRGSAEDLIYTDVHQTAESVDARGAVTLGTPRVSTGRYTGGRGVAVSGSAGENESSRIQERKHEASAAVRLVDKDGDVIWSTIQESKGAKFRGASADVAEKITRQLVADYERARKGPPIGTVRGEPAAGRSLDNAKDLPR
jgi:hypothetical protein